jgi:hypothetical protein
LLIRYDASDESPVVKTAASGDRSFQLCPVVIRSQLLRVPFVPFTAGAILDPVGALVRESRVRLSLLFALADGVPPTWELSPVWGASFVSLATPAGEFCGALLIVCARALPVKSVAAVIAMNNVLIILITLFLRNSPFQQRS